MSDSATSITPVTAELLVDRATAWIKARRRRGETAVSRTLPDQDETPEERIERLQIRDIGWKLNSHGGLDLRHGSFDAVHDRYGSAAAERITIARAGIHDWVS